MGKHSLRRVIKMSFPEPCCRNTPIQDKEFREIHFAEEAHLDGHEDRPMPTGLKG